MIKIYLCDDNSRILEFLKTTIEKSIVIHNRDMSIALATQSPDTLLSVVNQESEQSIYFLDVDLKHPHYDGFKLAQAIRKSDSRGFIIFVTTHGELVAETFKHRVEALDYIVKDDVQALATRIDACFDSIQARVSHLENRQPQFFTVKIFDEQVHVDLDDILYFETSSKKHRIILHALHETLEFFGSLNDIESALPEQFMRVHRSYIANHDKIKRVLSKEMELEFVDGSHCSVSRSMRKKVLEDR